MKINRVAAITGGDFARWDFFGKEKKGKSRFYGSFSEIPTYLYKENQIQEVTIMKKAISFILVLALLFAVASPVMNVSAAGKYITVYVEGYGHTLYKNNIKTEENRIYNIDVNVGERVSEVLKPCLEQLAAGFVTDDYDKYCDELYNAMAPLYDEVRLDKNGEATDGSGYGGNMLTDGYRIHYNKGLSGGRITFQYDWRLSVEHNAEILEQFIDRVCREQRTSKVNLLGRCLGGNIVSAYLQNGSNLDKINKVIMYIPSTMGLSTIGALFTGNVVLEGDAIEHCANNLIYNKDLITDPYMQELITTLVEMLNYASVLGVGLDALSFIVDKVKDNIIPRLVRDTYGSFPSFWAMCPSEDVYEAVDFCYGTDELKAEYKGTIDKIISYKENVQDKAEERMKELSSQGMDIMVLSKYNLPNLPFSEDGTAQSDAMAETYRTSFGSTSPKYGKVFSDKYISAMSEEDKRFLSPDLKVDASTCLFPEKTWFIKNCSHADFPNTVDAIMDAFLLNDGFTVFSSEAYPQFMDYSYDEAMGKETLVPVTDTDEDAKEKTKTEERFSIFIRFFTVIAEFFTKLLNGELNFSFGKDE